MHLRITGDMVFMCLKQIFLQVRDRLLEKAGLDYKEDVTSTTQASLSKEEVAKVRKLFRSHEYLLHPERKMSVSSLQGSILNQELVYFTMLANEKQNFSLTYFSKIRHAALIYQKI